MAEPLTTAPNSREPADDAGLHLTRPQRIALILGLLLIIASAVISTDILAPRDRNPATTNTQPSTR